MRRVAATWIAVVAVVAACASVPEGALQPEVAPSPEVSTPVLSKMIVLKARAGLELGDTVEVDLGSISEAGRVTRYEGGRAAGAIPLNGLGPTGTGRMVVTASRLNVRRCRSTGCSVVGYVERGQELEVSDFAGRWYRVKVDGQTTGYAMAEHLQLSLVQQRQALDQIRRRAAEYYEGELGILRTAGADLFSGYAVKLEDEMLSFAFYTRYGDGEALASVCAAMRGIAQFVHESIEAYPPHYFPAYSAGVYLDPSAGAESEVMVAGLTGDGGVYCRSPN